LSSLARVAGVLVPFQIGHGNFLSAVSLACSLLYGLCNAFNTFKVRSHEGSATDATCLALLEESIYAVTAEDFLAKGVLTWVLRNAETDHALKVLRASLFLVLMFAHL
jgi:hypothetical protein